MTKRRRGEENGAVAEPQFALEVAKGDPHIAYLRLPTHPGTKVCRMSKSVRLRDVMGADEGPDVVLDFDERGVLVGIEVL